MTKVQTRAGAVVCHDRGSGPPVVLLPAGAHTARDYDPIAPGLAGYRAISVDWPGHGDSPAPAPNAATAMAFAEAAEDVVTRLAPEGAVVIGNSVGGFAAARLAARRPDLVRALVLCAPGGFGPRNLQVRAFCAAMGRPGLLRRIYPQWAARYVRAHRDEDRRVLDETLAAMRDREHVRTVASLWRSFASPEHSIREEVASITAPTLVVAGTRDPVMPVALARELTAALPDGRMVEFDCGHIPFASAPEAFSGALRLFLAQALPDEGAPRSSSAIGVTRL